MFRVGVTMEYFQKKNSLRPFNYECIRYKNLNFIPHLHKDIEFVYVAGGVISVTVEQRVFTLREGDSALILSCHEHSYATEKESDVFVWIISNDFVPSFASETENKTCESPVFRPTDETAALIKKYMMPDSAPCGILRRKACFYAICAEFCENCELTIKKSKKRDLSVGILSYISEHYRENISLSSLAEALNYEKHYLSRYIHSQFGMNFRQYLNSYRAAYARQLIREGKMKVTEAAFESGFQSLRSFYRYCADNNKTKNDNE